MYMQYCEHLHVSFRIISHWVATYLSKVTLGAVSVGAAHKHSVCQVVLLPHSSEGTGATRVEQYVMVVLTSLLDSGERREEKGEREEGEREERREGGRERGRRGGREGGREGGGEGGREKGRRERGRRGGREGGRRRETGEERVIIRVWLGDWRQSACKFDCNAKWYGIQSGILEWIQDLLDWKCRQHNHPE